MKKCPSRSLTPYLDDELPPEARTEVEEHLQSCAACGALLDEVTSARERVHSMGRAFIPDTVLMPALEIFRDKGGIGQGRQLDFSQIPTPASAEAAAVVDEVDQDERYHAVLSTPATEAVTQVSGSPTWVNVTSPATIEEPEAIDEPEAIAQPEPEPEPVVAADSVPGVEVEAPDDAPEVAGGDPSAAARWLGPDFDEAISAEDPHALEAGAALHARPAPPAPQQVPPWLEAEEADTEDIEAHGRRVVEEDLEAERLRAKSRSFAVPEPLPPAEEAPALQQPEEPLIERAHEPEPEPEPTARRAPGLAPAAEGGAEADSSIEGYRDALRNRSEHRRRSAGLDSLNTEVKIGMGIAATMVLLLAATLGLPRLFTGHTKTAAAAATVTPRPSALPASPGTAVATAPSQPASAPPVVPLLTGVKSVGSAGTGYRAYRIRSLRPGAGLYLIAFDLQGSGPLPDVQLGEAADHTLYLQSAGTTIDPALFGAFPGAGPVTTISPTGAAATSLKLTTSRPAHFYIYYLTGPARLVIELS